MSSQDLLPSLRIIISIGNGAGSNIKVLVDVRRDGLNLRSELLLDLVQVETIFVGDQVDRHTKMTVSTTSSDTMKIGFRVLGEVEVDDDVDGLDIDTSREEI